MTIGIGVLGSTNGRNIDAVTLISDSMGSTDTDSTSALSKMFTEGNIHGVAAGSITVASELFHAICQEIGKLGDDRNHGSIWKSISQAVNGVRVEKFFWEVVQHEFVIESDARGRVFASE